MKKIIYTLFALLIIGAFLLAYYTNTHREVRPQPNFSDSKTIMDTDAIPPYVRDVCKETNDQAPGCLK